jgi:pilus assembly protein CpaE
VYRRAHGPEARVEEPARIVLGVEAPDVAEEVLHFLDRTGRARVVATAGDARQLLEAVRQLEPDAVVASPSIAPGEGALNGAALLALDTRETVAGLRRSIRAGARGFYLWPDERAALAEAAGTAGATAGVPGARRARVVGVCGARGGAGATFVATHLAAAFARRGSTCALVDATVGQGDLRTALGIPPDQEIRTLTDVMPVLDELSIAHLDEVTWPHPDGFGALLGMDAADGAAGPVHLGRVLETLGRERDAVVVHLPRASDAGVGDALDRLVVVLTLDVQAFHDAKALLSRLGVSGDDERVALVVDRARRGEIVPSDVARVFGRRPLAVIPTRRAVASAQDHGRLLPRRDRTMRAIERLARRLEMEDEAG